jgi:hypothetical protein
VITAADPIVNLRRMAIRRSEIMRFRGKGYWAASRSRRILPENAEAAA